MFNKKQKKVDEYCELYFLLKKKSIAYYWNVFLPDQNYICSNHTHILYRSGIICNNPNQSLSNSNNEVSTINTNSSSTR
jgi:hypothetical protein